MLSLQPQRAKQPLLLWPHTGLATNSVCTSRSCTCVAMAIAMARPRMHMIYMSAHDHPGAKTAAGTLRVARWRGSRSHSGLRNNTCPAVVIKHGLAKTGGSRRPFLPHNATNSASPLTKTVQMLISERQGMMEWPQHMSDLLVKTRNCLNPSLVGVVCLVAFLSAAEPMVEAICAMMASATWLGAIAAAFVAGAAAAWALVHRSMGLSTEQHKLRVPHEEQSLEPHISPITFTEGASVPSAEEGLLAMLPSLSKTSTHNATLVPPLNIPSVCTVPTKGQRQQQQQQVREGEQMQRKGAMMVEKMWSEMKAKVRQGEREMMGAGLEQGQGQRGSAIVGNDNAHGEGVGREKARARAGGREQPPSLHLQALQADPCRRLLTATVMQLHHQVKCIPSSDVDLRPQDWSAQCTSLLVSAVNTVLATWLSSEASQAWKKKSNNNIITATDSPQSHMEGWGSCLGHGAVEEEYNKKKDNGMDESAASAKCLSGMERLQMLSAKPRRSQSQPHDDRCMALPQIVVRGQSYVIPPEGNMVVLDADKQELYADLIFYLRFYRRRRKGAAWLEKKGMGMGGGRFGCMEALEDMVCAVAEAVAALYLDQLSSSSSSSSSPTTTPTTTGSSSSGAQKLWTGAAWELGLGTQQNEQRKRLTVGLAMDDGDDDELQQQQQGCDDDDEDDDEWSAIVHPRLATTRSLDKFRNEVALQKWMRKNFSSVMAMYEDRQELWTFQFLASSSSSSSPSSSSSWAALGVEVECGKSGEVELAAATTTLGGSSGRRRGGTGTGPWEVVLKAAGWGRKARLGMVTEKNKKKNLRASAREPGHHHHHLVVAFQLLSIPIQRRRELRQLRGWRLVYSLYLEVTDVVGPVVRVMLKKMASALSFLFVTLLGRSLSLLYHGIRQSLTTP